LSTWATVKKLAKELPEVEESTWANTPSCKVRKRSFVRLREDDVIVVLMDEDEKEALLRAEPEIFFTTPHYDGYPAVLVRLSAIEPEELREILVESWRRVAPKRLLEVFDEASSFGSERVNHLGTSARRSRRRLRPPGSWGP
jgi:hypothetical protein